MLSTAPLLWAYLHGEKLFLVGGFPSLPCCILLSSLPFEEGLLFCSLKLLFSTYIIVTGSWQSPIFNFVHWNSFFRLTSLLQDLDSLPFSIYMLFTGSWQSPFFDLHVINSLPFFIYMLFTESWQSPFFNLHVIYRILTVSLFQFTWLLFTGSWQSLFFNLHVIYRILTVSLFNLHVINSLPFWIYMLFTEYWQSPFLFSERIILNVLFAIRKLCWTHTANTWERSAQNNPFSVETVI